MFNVFMIPPVQEINNNFDLCTDNEGVMGGN
jgi:hypothetical protein